MNAICDAEVARRNMPATQSHLLDGRYRLERPFQCELFGYTAPLEQFHSGQGFPISAGESAVVGHVQFHVGCFSIGTHTGSSFALSEISFLHQAWILISMTSGLIGFVDTGLQLQQEQLSKHLSLLFSSHVGSALSILQTSVSQSALDFGCCSHSLGVTRHSGRPCQAPAIKAARYDQVQTSVMRALFLVFWVGQIFVQGELVLLGIVFMALWLTLWACFPGRRSPLGHLVSCGCMCVPCAILQPLGFCASPSVAVLDWRVRRYAIRSRQRSSQVPHRSGARLCHRLLLVLGLANMPAVVWAAPAGVPDLVRFLNEVQARPRASGYVEPPVDLGDDLPFAQREQSIDWPQPYSIVPRPNIRLGSLPVVSLRPGAHIEAENALEWLGVIVLAPYYQTQVLAVHMPHIHDAVDLIDTLCEHCADLFDPGLDCFVPLTPQRFGDSYATVLKYASNAGDSCSQAQAAVVFDLTRVGGPYYAAMHPIHTTVEALIQVAMPLTSYGRDPFDVYVGDSDQPCAIFQDLLLYNGDVITIISSGLQGPRTDSIDALFRLPPPWGAVCHTPQEICTPSVCVINAEQRLLLSYFHHSRQSVCEAIRERLRKPVGSLTFCAAEGFRDLLEDGIHCDRAVAAVELSAPQDHARQLPRRRDVFTFCDLRPVGRLPECHHSHSFVVHLPTLLHLFGVRVPFGLRVCVDGAAISGSDAFVGSNTVLVFRFVTVMPSPDLTPRSEQTDGPDHHADEGDSDKDGGKDERASTVTSLALASSVSDQPHEASVALQPLNLEASGSSRSPNRSTFASVPGRSLLAACVMQRLGRVTAAPSADAGVPAPVTASDVEDNAGQAISLGVRAQNRPPVVPPRDPVSFVTLAEENGDATSELVLGLALFAPHYQTEYLSICVHNTEGPWSVFERVRHLPTRIPTHLLTCLAFVDPLPFEGVAAFVAYSEAVHASGYVAVVLDLAGCGGNLFATTLPRSFTCAQFFAFVQPLLGAASESLALFVGREAAPQNPDGVLQLEHGQKLTVVYAPAVPVHSQTYFQLFEHPRLWVVPDEIPRPVISSGVCLLHQERRFYIGRRAFPGQSPQAAAAHCIRSTEDQVTVGVARHAQIADLCLHGERCKCVAAVVDIPPPLPVPPARRVRTDVFLFLDLRPLGIRPHFRFQHQSTWSLSDILRDFLIRLPEGFKLRVQGGQLRGDRLTVNNGTTVLFYGERSSGVGDSSDASSSDGESDGLHDGPDAAGDDDEGIDPDSSGGTDEAPVRPRSRSPRRFGYAGCALWARCLWDSIPAPDSLAENRVVMLGTSRAHPPNRLLQVLFFNQVVAVSCKILEEPTPYTATQLERLDTLRYYAGEFGLPWRYLPAWALYERLEHIVPIVVPARLPAFVLVRLHFDILVPGYLAEHVVITTALPTSVDHVLQLVQAERDPDLQQWFPVLIPAIPQPAPTAGVLLALPFWNPHAVVVVLDARGLDGRIFAVQAPLYVAKHSLLQLAGVPPGARVTVCSADDGEPLPIEGEFRVFTGQCFLLLPEHVPIPRSHMLSDMLQAPGGWDSAFTTSLPDTPDCYCCVTAHGHILHALDPDRPWVYRAEIAAICNIPVERVYIQPAQPRLQDSQVFGYACRTVIAVGPQTPSAFYVIVDCRPLMQGWSCFLTAGSLDVETIRTDLGEFAPPGWHVQLRNVPSAARVVQAHEGQVFIAEYAQVPEDDYLSEFPWMTGSQPSPSSESREGYPEEESAAQTPLLGSFTGHTSAGSEPTPSGQQRRLGISHASSSGDQDVMWNRKLTRQAHPTGTYGDTPCIFGPGSARRCPRVKVGFGVLGRLPAHLLAVYLFQCCLTVGAVVSPDDPDTAGVKSLSALDAAIPKLPSENGVRHPTPGWHSLRVLPTPCRAKITIPSPLPAWTSEDLVTLLSESAASSHQWAFLAATLLETLIEHFQGADANTACQGSHMPREHFACHSLPGGLSLSLSVDSTARHGPLW